MSTYVVLSDRENTITQHLTIKFLIRSGETVYYAEVLNTIKVYTEANIKIYFRNDYDGLICHH